MADRLSIEWETDVFERYTAALIRGLDEESSARVLRAVALEFLGRVIRKTPVDKGRARAGWTSFLLASGLPADVGGSDATAIAQGQRESFFESNFQGGSPFIVLGNAVPYIVVLEFGHSGQAPAGMMRITFRELRAGQVMTREYAKEVERQFAEANKKARAEARKARRN